MLVSQLSDHCGIHWIVLCVTGVIILYDIVGCFCMVMSSIFCMIMRWSEVIVSLFTGPFSVSLEKLFWMTSQGVSVVRSCLFNMIMRCFFLYETEQIILAYNWCNHFSMTVKSLAILIWHFSGPVGLTSASLI